MGVSPSTIQTTITCGLLCDAKIRIFTICYNGKHATQLTARNEEIVKERWNMLRILHTADWHLGRSLYRRQRYHEFEAFLNWLEATIIQRGIDVLLVAGDVF